MLFVGDIALPKEYSIPALTLNSTFDVNAVIANLEGALISPGPPGAFSTAVYNDMSVLSFLRKLNIRVVSLANNHISDVCRSPSATINTLKAHGILSCGAGDNLEEASQPTFFEDSGKKILLLAYGWEVIGCRPASKNFPGINPLQHDHISNGVQAARRRYPNHLIVLLMHWNYELELYPQPMHRQLSFRAIENGANGIIGCHSHCVQGIEIYKGAPIVYGLGNWFFPEGKIYGRNVRFPDFALLELAFEWKPGCKDGMVCHWYHFDRSRQGLTYERSERLNDSRRIMALTPFSGMNHEEYIAWFKQNRRKKKLLPVYTSCDSIVRNNINDAWVHMRQRVLDTALSVGLKRKLR